MTEYKDEKVNSAAAHYRRTSVKLFQAVFGGRQVVKNAAPAEREAFDALHAAEQAFLSACQKVDAVVCG